MPSPSTGMDQIQANGGGGKISHGEGQDVCRGQKFNLHIKIMLKKSKIICSIMLEGFIRHY